MMDLVVLAGSGVLGLWGYVTSRRFVRERLRFVPAAQASAAPVIAGAVATLAAAPIVWLLPLVGGVTAALFGLGVGFGSAHGGRDARRSLRAITQ